MSRNYCDKMGNMDCHWDETLASSEGMHFHLWIPKSNPESEQNFLSQFRYQTNLNRDAVSFSWSYLEN